MSKMGETTLVKADRRLVKQAHELGANVRRVVDLALEDYINRNLVLKPEIRAGKRPSRECNGGMVKEDTLLKKAKPDCPDDRWCGRRDSNPRRELGKLVS